LKRRIFLTGGSGFIGTHLKRFLESRDCFVSAPNTQFSETEAFTKDFQNGAPWDAAIHLAGLSSIAEAAKHPYQALSVNLAGTVFLATLARLHSPNCQFVFASTAQIYAPPQTATGSTVLTENSPICPSSLYAESKLLAEICLRSEHDLSGLQVTVLRLFNHSHKSQSSVAFLPSIFEQLQKVKSGGHVELATGNIDIKRDMGSIADLLSAFEAVLLHRSKLAPFEILNVCSGHARTLRALVIQLASRLDVHPDFRIDERRVRQGEPESICGSNTKLQKLTGWTPKAVSDQDFISSFLEEI
jgi:nucleoside-diphosphate-sugar epimerase